MSQAARARLCVVTTSPFIVQVFLVPLLTEFSAHFDVTLVAAEECSQFLPSVRMHVIPLKRQIAPVHDVSALAQLVAFLARNRFDAILTIAPKAGLLGIIAAKVTRVPFRCHVFQGEVWATRHGLMRILLKNADRLVARLANEVLVVSHSERDFLMRNRIITATRSRVLGAGSLSGVDTKRFAPDPLLKARVRRDNGIADDATLVIFLGRLAADKGILDLAAAWRSVALKNSTLHLIIAGPDEDELIPRVRQIVGRELETRLHVRGLISDPESWFAASDIAIFPSYREGLGMAILEASATALPVIATRIYGITDAVIENETALLHAPGDRAALAACLDRLFHDLALRNRLGTAGRAFVKRTFEQSVVLTRIADYVKDAIAKWANV
jgi:glycosyltransferase involved in cell wall biosynthesis